MGVGFGISTADHVAAVTQVANMAIVGTEMVRQIAADPHAAATQASACLRRLHLGLG